MQPQDNEWLYNGDPISPDRFNGPMATERYQPWSRAHALKTKPVDTMSNPPNSLVSTITRGPTGVGATYEFLEPVGSGQFEHVEWEAPAVIVMPS